MRTHLIVILLAMISTASVMQSCGRKLVPQDSCNFVQNPEMQRVSWKGQIPIRLFVHSSVPSEAFDAIDRAVHEYNTSMGEEMFQIVARGASGALEPKKDGSSMIYWFNTWDPQKPTEQARTTIYWSGEQIFEADIRINNHNFSYNFSDSTSFSNLDLQSLLVHEFGHALGLAHTLTPGSVMNFSLNDGQDRRRLGSMDLSSLHCEY